VRLFDDAAAEYDAARPSYPSGLYDLLEVLVGGLAGKLVADGGAGTGVATRQLADGGARVVAFDPGVGMLLRAVRRTPGLPAMVADAGAVPMRSCSLDMICFAQSWHWVDQRAGAAEAARVLRPSGWWAAWWNHPWADGEAWFDRYYSVLEQLCPGLSREQRNTDWCQNAICDLDEFAVPERHIIWWERPVHVDEWMVDQRSHSYVIVMSEPERRRLLTDLEAIAWDRFTDGHMTVPYQTRVWVARRR
jgi:SAM-dependent methyltransferase